MLFCFLTHSYTFVEYVVSGNTLKATPTGTVELHTHTLICCAYLTHTHVSLFHTQGYAFNRPPLDRVIVIGVASSPSVVTKDGKNVPFSYDSSKLTLTIGKGLQTGMDTKYSINWK